MRNRVLESDSKSLFFFVPERSAYSSQTYNADILRAFENNDGGRAECIMGNKSSNDVTSAILVCKTLDNNDLNQVVASSGCSENKGLGGVLSLTGS